MNCYCDYEAPEFYRRTKRTARKSHKCSECGYAIRPQEEYEHTSGKWGGMIDSFKTCSDCLSLRVAFEEMDCFCWMHGGLAEAINEQMAEASFTPGGRFAYLRLIAKHRRNMGERMCTR